MLGLSPVRVVTFGQSFHRTNRLVVAETVYQVLESGGSLVLISHDPAGAASARSHLADPARADPRAGHDLLELAVALGQPACH
jgi:hypothetical protein